jgi:hypothetical protein
MLSRDGIAGLVCLAASLGLLAGTWNLPGPSLLVPVGPGFYPRIILGITAALALALTVFDFVATRRRASAAAEKPAAAAPNYRLVLIVFAVFGVYVGLLPGLGFRISTFLFIAALQALLEPPRAWKGWLIVAITAFVTTAAVYFLFERYLSVLLPRGQWTGF